ITIGGIITIKHELLICIIKRKTRNKLLLSITNVINNVPIRKSSFHTSFNTKSFSTIINIQTFLYVWSCSNNLRSFCPYIFLNNVMLYQCINQLLLIEFSIICLISCCFFYVFYII